MSHILSSTRRPQTFREEVLNTASHALGLIALISAAPFLLVQAYSQGGSIAAAGAGVFATSGVLLYMSSVIYHALPRNRAKKLFQLIDHSAIYLLIAGTYTPFTLGVLKGVWGWTLLGTVWSLALVGIVFKALYGVRYPLFSMTLYIVMGWLIVFAVKPLIDVMSITGITWLVAGGISYMIGVIFFAFERIPYFHFVWHIFVLIGTATHFVAILLYAV